MSGKFSLLFLASTLLFSACNDKEVAPAPQQKASLEGRWVWQKATITRYDADNQLISSAPQVAVPGASYLDITDETLQRFYSDGTALTPPLNYVQDGPTIYYDRARSIITILDLTDEQLILHAEGEFTPGRGHTNTDTYYVR
jgi:hypothetical protein